MSELRENTAIYAMAEKALHHFDRNGWTYHDGPPDVEGLAATIHEIADDCAVTGGPVETGRLRAMWVGRTIQIDLVEHRAGYGADSCVIEFLGVLTRGVGDV